ncbi:MAG: nitrilase-related carbon-nitrogen hydrolase [Hymenobacter sp.]
MAIRAMAAFTEPIKAKMMELAVSYNINIVAGSMPVYEDGKLHNVAYLCRRDGTVDEQYKLHVTPDEASYWGMRGGDKLKCFDTDFGKIGILVCYDVEFPELARMLSDEGMKILFVPFWTDTKNSYQRVRICAAGPAPSKTSATWPLPARWATCRALRTWTFSTRSRPCSALRTSPSRTMPSWPRPRPTRR